MTKLLADRKSTRLNSSHANISYAVFCLKKFRAGFLSIKLAIQAQHCTQRWTPPPSPYSLKSTSSEQSAREPTTLIFFNDTATTEIYPLSLHDALPIWFREMALVVVISRNNRCRARNILRN